MSPPRPLAHPPLVLIGKPQCHLCDEMKAVVEPVARGLGLSLVLKDLRTDAELERRYREEIPVLLFGDVEVARHRATAEALATRLQELTAPRT